MNKYEMIINISNKYRKDNEKAKKEEKEKERKRLLVVSGYDMDFWDKRTSDRQRLGIIQRLKELGAQADDMIEYFKEKGIEINA